MHVSFYILQEIDILSGLDKQQNKRLKILTAKLVFFLIVGIIYFFFVLFTHWRLPCIVNVITKKYCTGCGTTRMVMALSHLDFGLAFKSNAFVFIFLPIGIIWGIYRGVLYVKSAVVSFSKFESISLIIIFIIAIAFTVIRNFERFSFLQPV